MALVEVATVSPGAISAVVFVLEAEDQSELQFGAREQRREWPAEKALHLRGRDARRGRIGRQQPKAVWKAWSTAVLAAEVGVE